MELILLNFISEIGIDILNIEQVINSWIFEEFEFGIENWFCDMFINLWKVLETGIDFLIND